MSKGTLILGILCVAQFALLLLIYSNNDADSEYRQSSKLPASVESFLFSGAGTNDQIASGSRDGWISENRLRQVIQEELRSHIRNIERNSLQQRPQHPADSSVDESAIARHRDFVSGQLDYYSSVGNISSAEMAQLYTSIARLDEGGRREMMSRLNRALNSGALKAAL